MVDVALHTCHDCSIKCCHGTNECDELKHSRLAKVEREQTCHQIHTGNNHCSGMDKGRNRCRAFHCIGEPDVQWEHCRLTGTSHEYQSQGPCHNRATKECGATGSGHYSLRRGGKVEEIECLRIERKDEDTDEESEVGKTCYNKCFLRCCHGFGLSVVEADEQIRRYTHKFPENIHLEDVGGNNQTEHREREERQKCIIALEAFLAMHIAEAIEVHHDTVVITISIIADIGSRSTPSFMVRKSVNCSQVASNTTIC